MFKFFHFDVEDGVGIATFDRPPVNALSREVYESLDRMIDHIEGSPDVRVLVLAASDASRAWIGGADLNEFSTLTYETRVDRHAFATRVTDRFYNLSRPTIAAIRKPAVGGGVVFASFCDIRVASEDTFFSMPEVDRGLTGGAGAYLHRLNMPVGLIREIILTGRRLPSRELETSGFLNYVLPDQEVMPKAMELARMIAAKSLPVVEAIKSSANLMDMAGWQEGRKVASDHSARLTGSADYREGISAFFDGRKPSYTDR